MDTLEDVVLILAYLLMLLFFIFKLTRKKVKPSIRIHFLLFTLYAGFIFYNRAFNSLYGAALTWLFYGAIILILHALVMVLQRTLKYWN